METAHIAYYPVTKYHFDSNKLEEAYYNAMLCYSLRHLTFIENTSHEDVMDALQKSIQICRLAGVNSQHHFKQIYVYDASIGTLHVDWMMSKKGFNLMVMQIPSLNEQLARWLWQLANL